MPLHLHCLPGQGVRIGEGITVTVSAIKRGGATLVIDAPRDIKVRHEKNLDDRTSEEPNVSGPPLPGLPTSV